MADTREWKKPCSAITSIAASRIRWCLSEIPLTESVARFTRLFLNPIPLDCDTRASKEMLTFPCRLPLLFIGLEPFFSAVLPVEFDRCFIPLQKFPEGFASMAILGFDRRLQFSKRALQFRQEKQRIV